ncbi:MAG: ROK family protein [Verrucomicrobia bacterium]|nr:MAG: ROK family protein [Verrucomicrobiota bacterium]
MKASPLTIGIDFGGTTVKLSVVQDSVLLESVPPIATQEFDEPNNLIDAMVSAVDELRQRHPQIAAVGIGMPGFVNFEKGEIYHLTNVRGWCGIPLRKIMEDRLQCPVAVENDANCMGYAEWKWGAGKGMQHVVFISLGTGVGGAIIANGQMIRGMRHGAGEIGQTSIDYKGRSGQYHNRGALEDYIGNQEIATMAQATYRTAGIDRSLADCSPAALAGAAIAGDVLASQVWQTVGQMLATAAMNLCWLLNPQAIVIGGGVARAGEILLDPLRTHLFAQLSGPFRDDLQILTAHFGHDAGIIGAASLARGLIQSPSRVASA